MTGQVLAITALLCLAVVLMRRRRPGDDEFRSACGRTEALSTVGTRAACARPRTGTGPRHDAELQMMRRAVLGMLLLGLLASLGVIAGMAMTTFDVSSASR
jgi:hypothetical protein